MSEAGPATGKYDRYPTHPSVDLAIASLASRQHAVVTLAQLQKLGLTQTAVHKRTAAGRLHRVYLGVYSLVPVNLLSKHGRWLAAVLTCGPGAVLSHRTAAALHDLRQTDRANVDVSVPGRSCRTRAGIDVHRSTTLTAADTTVVNGIPCTSVARTLLDLADVVNRRSLERVFDRAEMLEILDLGAIEHQLAPNHTRPAARLVRALLAEHYVGSTPTESELEEAFLALCRRLGLPKPDVNRWIDLHDGQPMIRADFVWPAQRVIVETDGHRVHGTHQARERDPRRDQRAMVAGWRPIRTTWRQVMRRPWELESTLLALVA